MPDSLRITLRYHGPAVDDGTMPAEEVIDALQGFSGAYGKIATQVEPNVTHQLRVTGIKTGSFDLLILAATQASTYAEQLKAIETAARAARYIFGLITELINAKKHTKGKPYDISVKGNGNTVVVINAEGCELALSPPALELYKTKIVDPDLNKIASPLRPNIINSAELVAGEGTPDSVGTSINSTEREYFRPDPSSSTTKETEVIGHLVSLNKETNRGTFRLSNKQGIPYQYIGQHPENFYADFSYKGPVRAVCLVEFDENLTPIHLGILDVHQLQGELPLLPPAEQ